MAEPILDINLLDTFSLESIAVLDTSKYPPNFTKTNPSLEVTAPGYEAVTLDFTPTSLQVYKSSNLGVVCEWCDEVQLPDGIWTFKYSIYPATKYYVIRKFAKVDRLQAKLDEAYIALDRTQCDERLKKSEKELLDTVESYIHGAVAAGNKCVDKLFHSFYSKATELLNNFLNSKSCARI